jgi:hypothetical protein
MFFPAESELRSISSFNECSSKITKDDDGSQTIPITTTTTVLRRRQSTSSNGANDFIMDVAEGGFVRRSIHPHHSLTAAARRRKRCSNQTMTENKKDRARVKDTSDSLEAGPFLAKTDAACQTCGNTKGAPASRSAEDGSIGIPDVA